MLAPRRLPGLRVDVAAPPAVEALKEALRVIIRDPENKKELEYRRLTLQERIDALHGVRELRLALLQEWRDEDRDESVASIDRAIRNGNLKWEVFRVDQNGRVTLDGAGHQ